MSVKSPKGIIKTVNSLEEIKSLPIVTKLSFELHNGKITGTSKVNIPKLVDTFSPMTLNILIKEVLERVGITVVDNELFGFEETELKQSFIEWFEAREKYRKENEKPRTATAAEL
jgi:hypothetical protein